MSETRERVFFLAHAKSDEDLTVKLEAAKAAVDRVSGGKPYRITLGRDYFEQRFKDAGSWAAWTAEVAQGQDPITRRAIFDGILVPAGRIGTGTAGIVKKSLEVGKPVFSFDLAGNLGRITGVETVDPRDWQTGHRMIGA